MPLYVVENTQQSSQRPRISGRSLAHRKAGARQRSCMAAQALLGEADYTPTNRQVAAAFGVSIPYLELALSLSPAKRAAIAAGRDETSFILLNTLRKIHLHQQQLSAAG